MPNETGVTMQKRRSPWVVVHLLIGLVLVLVSVSSAAFASRVDDLIPIVLTGIPGLVLVIRAPMFGVSFGAAGVTYSGLLRARSYTWQEVEAVRSATVSGTLFSSDVPELVLTDGNSDQLSLLAGYGRGEKVNERVRSLVADLEKARTAALPS
ncbi:hypothetical protein ABT247_27190 [Kitasatospora sp. NPDC001539]|uniref:hypothetical protein n=1 Tax=Kitasatospora sp. NPDC001539 TaxID=3154384 RepID=UPI00332DF1AD